MLDKKQKIEAIIKSRGPSLPSHVSNQIELSLLFTSALLSEMVAEKTLRLTHLKIGGSPLYYLAGQEQQLENFINNLPTQEKEVVRILKEKRILEDDKLTPLQRVALRNTKDFAIIVKHKLGDREKVFWQYYLVPEEEANKEIKNIIDKEMEKLKIAEAKPQILEAKPETIQIKEVKPQPEIPVEEKIQTKEPKEKLLHEIKPKKRARKKTDVFIEKVLENLKKKNIEILREIKQENKICIALVDSEIGLLKFLVYGINKKTLNEADLSLASTQGQEEKLPVLLVTQGKLTKKASEYLKKLSNLTIYKL